MSHIIKCEVCSNRILSHARALRCNLCLLSYHVKCLPLSALNTDGIFHSDMCLNCTSHIFPFNHISCDKEFYNVISHSAHHPRHEFSMKMVESLIL